MFWTKGRFRILEYFRVGVSRGGAITRNILLTSDVLQGISVALWSSQEPLREPAWQCPEPQEARGKR